MSAPYSQPHRRVLLTRLAVANSRIAILETERAAFFQREDSSPTTPWPGQAQLEALRQGRADLEARLRQA